ncbi:hypothetical protein CCYA_CCYA04G1189 [Cyanidiococcus yangmingshanensis]|nr:hypothetical protein CCYA_CCYA04G1189 [Cyanidiococcus yangmingshanensis]
MDTTASYHVLLAVLSIETFLFFAVIAQTAAQEPLAHAQIARYFGLAFLSEAIAALAVSVLPLLKGSLFLLDLFSLVANVAIWLGAIVAIIGAAFVVFPEESKREARVALVLLLAFVFAFGAVRLYEALDVTPPTLAFWSANALRLSIATSQGAMAGVGAACLLRAFARPKMRGRNGASVLLFGTLVCFLGSLIWTWLLGKCEASGVDKDGLSCPLPLAFDHNALYCLFLIAGNILSAEGVLRLMAVGDGAMNYAEIP